MTFNMAAVDISVVGEDICAKLGEGPHWDVATQTLLWVDSFDYSVHLLDPKAGKVQFSSKGNFVTVDNLGPSGSPLNLSIQ